MKRVLSLVAALLLVSVVVAFALQNRTAHPQLDWAKKAANAKPRLAILLEFGHKDIELRDWSGQATVTGAKYAGATSYRFRDKDALGAFRLGDDNGFTISWTARSRLPVRAPKGQPAVSKLEPVATIGVVLHMQDVTPDAKMQITFKDGQKAEVMISDVVSGKTQAILEGAAVVRLVTAATPIASTPAEEDHPAACYGPDGTLWVAYIAYKNRDESRRLEAANLKEQPKNFKAFYKPDAADQLFVVGLKDGKWSTPIAVTGPKEDLARCAVAAAGNGDVWIVYSANRKGNFDLYGRKLSNGKLEVEDRITTNPGADLTPVMATDANGIVWLAAQSWDDKGHAGINVYRYTLGTWAPVERLQGEPGENCWHPAIAAAPNGKVAVGYDVYHRGSYDVRVAVFDGKIPPKSVAVAASPKFEARPSLVYDASGRLWIAYEEGPELWGKDYGAFAPDKGKPLYNERSVRVVCLDTDGKLKRTTAELPTSKYDPPVLPFEPVKTAKYERTTRYGYPKIGIDGDGRVWLAYRQNFGNRYSSHPGSYWLTFVRRLDGQNWNQPIEVNHSDGLLDHRPVLLPERNGGLVVVHNTDGRFTTPDSIDNQIYVSTIDLPAKASALQLVEHDAGAPAKASAGLDAENASVKLMRTHRIKTGGNTYQYLRGEYHRHTEISWDGGADGSLEDMFRYAIDAAQMDWIGNGDHDNGAGREYSWWLTQKFSDAYYGKAFTTMFTYERSVAYPHGHRNVMFAQRGIMTLPRLAPPKGEPPLDPDTKKKKGAWPGGVHPDDAKMLYRYLHEFDGICASHTSATGMGTDWRDNDPVVEPIVEIYQGDRMSYEMEGAPRAGYDPQGGKEPANVAGWFPKGYVNLAFQKGYKLGFQASSDHWSTHISFFIILSEGRDRASLLKAVKQRHCYAATDNILVDFRSGEKIMGDDVVTSQAPKFQIHVVGTSKIAKIDVLRDSEVVDTLKPASQEHKSEWTDPAAPAGTHWYYVRVLQADGEIAWGTPMWVQKK